MGSPATLAGGKRVRSGSRKMLLCRGSGLGKWKASPSRPGERPCAISQTASAAPWGCHPSHSHALHPGTLEAAAKPRSCRMILRTAGCEAAALCLRVGFCPGRIRRESHGSSCGLRNFSSAQRWLAISLARSSMPCTRICWTASGRPCVEGGWFMGCLPARNKGVKHPRKVHFRQANTSRTEE